MSAADYLTLHQFAARYRMDHRTAAKWIEEGTAPGRKIPGTRRYLILSAHCDAYDRGEPGFWSAHPAVVPTIEHPYVVRSGGTR